MGAILGAAAIMGGSSLLGGILGAGSKPKIPPFTPVDASQEQNRAIQNNLANFQSASQLVSKASSFDQDTLTNQLRKAIPGYDQIVQKASQNIENQLSGQISPDVAAQVQRASAARALAGGYGGSGAAGNLTARDLGLTSMQIQQQGFGNALNYIQNQRQTAVAAPTSVTSMFLTPAQRVGIAQFNASGGMQQGNLAAQANAMPNPMAAAVGNSLQQVGGLYAGYALNNAAMQSAIQNQASMIGNANPFAYNSYANAPQNYGYGSYIPTDAGGS